VPPPSASATPLNRSGTRRSSRRQHAVVVWALVGLAALIFVAQGTLADAHRPTLGYTAYYTASWIVVHRDAVSRMYDSRWFIDQVPRAGIDHPRDIFNINPPGAALIVVPLVWMGPSGAKTVWTILNLGFLATAMLLIRRALPRAFPRATDNGAWFPALCGLALLATPVQDNVRLGQAYGLMLLLVVVGLGGFIDDDDRRVGLALGLMAFLKTAALLLWVAPLLERRARAIIWGIATIGAAIVVTLPLLGPRLWWEYPHWLPSLFNQSWTGVTAYQTIPSLAHHLTEPVATINPHPIMNLPWLAEPLAGALVAGWLIAAMFCLWPLARDLAPGQLRALRYCGLLALSVPLQPVGEEHHYIMLVPAIAVALLAAVETPAGPGRRAALIACATLGTLLIVAPIPFKDDRLRDSWWSLLAYPRLYGGLLVCTSILLAAVAEPKDWRFAAETQHDQPMWANTSTGMPDPSVVASERIVDAGSPRSRNSTGT